MSSPICVCRGRAAHAPRAALLAALLILAMAATAAACSCSRGCTSASVSIISPLKLTYGCRANQHLEMTRLEVRSTNNDKFSVTTRADNGEGTQQFSVRDLSADEGDSCFFEQGSFRTSRQRVVVEVKCENRILNCQLQHYGTGTCRNIETYTWQTGPWGSCESSQNGGGSDSCEQSRNVGCVVDSSGSVTSDSRCSSSTKPADTRACTCSSSGGGGSAGGNDDGSTDGGGDRTGECPSGADSCCSCSCCVGNFCSVVALDTFAYECSTGSTCSDACRTTFSDWCPASGEPGTVVSTCRAASVQGDAGGSGGGVSSSSSSSSNTLVLAGAAAGGCALLGALVGAFVCMRRRKRRKAAATSAASSAYNGHDADVAPDAEAPVAAPTGPSGGAGGAEGAGASSSASNIALATI